MSKNIKEMKPEKIYFINEKGILCLQTNFGNVFQIKGVNEYGLVCKMKITRL